MLSLKDFKKLYLFSCGFLVLPSKAAIHQAASSLTLKSLTESFEGEAAELVPHFLLPSVHKPVSSSCKPWEETIMLPTQLEMKKRHTLSSFHKANGVAWNWISMNFAMDLGKDHTTDNRYLQQLHASCHTDISAAMSKSSFVFTSFPFPPWQDRTSKTIWSYHCSEKKIMKVL